VRVVGVVGPPPDPQGGDALALGEGLVAMEAEWADDVVGPRLVPQGGGALALDEGLLETSWLAHHVGQMSLLLFVATASVNTKLEAAEQWHQHKH